MILISRLLRQIRCNKIQILCLIQKLKKIMKEVDEQHIEKWFGENVETWLFDPIDTIISTFVMTNPAKLNVTEVISEKNLDYLSLYISLQIIRSKRI